MAWELLLDGKKIAGAKRTCTIAPGAAQDAQITLNIPAVSKRTAGQLILTCSRGGKEIFREIKTIAVVDPSAAPPSPH